MPGPTLAGFQNFVETFMGIDTDVLPANSVYLNIALSFALSIVNPALRTMPFIQSDGAQVVLNPLDANTPVMTMYDFAVYNLAGDRLINWAQDQPGIEYFSAMRDKLNINGFTSGIVQSASDESTSVSLIVQKAAEAFTLSDLQTLKTPWGRAYLQIAQSYGPETWGVS